MPEIDYYFSKSFKSDRSYPFVYRYLPFDRFVIRPIAALLVRFFLRTKIVPLRVMYISYIIGIVGSACFAIGNRTSIALGGVLILLQDLIGRSDGMLAWVKNLCTRHGAYSEFYYDKIYDLIVMSGITYGYYGSHHDISFAFLGLGAISLYFIGLSLSFITSSFLQQEIIATQDELRSIFAFVLLLFSLFDRLGLIIVIGFISTLIAAIWKIIIFIRASRQTNEVQIR